MRAKLFGMLFIILSAPISADPIWSFAAAGAFPGRPAISDTGVVYAPSDDRHLYAFDIQSGELTWRAYLGDRPSGSITISGEGSILVGTRRRSLVAINPRGTEIWRVSLPDNVVGDPAVAADGTAFAALANGMLVAISHRGIIRYITSIRGGPGESFRDVAAGPGAAASPSITRDGVVLFPSVDGNLYAFDQLGNIAWNVVLAGVPTQAAIGDNGHLYVGTEYGTLVAISEDGRVMWDYVEKAPFLTPVCVDGGVISAATGGTVVKLDEQGVVAWRYTTGTTLSHIIAVDSRETVLLESINGEMIRIDSGGILGATTMLQEKSTGLTLSKDGFLVAGSRDWRISAFAASTIPADGWSSTGYDATHAGSVDTGDTKQRLDALHSGLTDYTYLNALLSAGSYSMLQTALTHLRKATQRSAVGPNYRFFEDALKTIASYGLIRVERTSRSVSNDYPDLRASAAELLPAVAGIRTNTFVAALISYEYDTYALIAAMTAAGLIGCDPDGEATRAIAAVVLHDLDRVRREEALGFAAVQGMKGIINYHGEPSDPAGLEMLLAMFRADLSGELRETTLEAIRSIRYY